MGSTRLFYEQPAQNWNEALPIGNGRLGAMIFGGVEKELIQMNEDSIWLGGYKNRNNPDALKNLPQVRKLLMEGKVAKGEKLLKRAFSGVPEGMQPYQTLGNLELCFEHDSGEAVDYRRSLDINSAVAVTEYRVGNTIFKREMIASNPDNCMVLHLSASENGKISFDARLSRGKEYDGVKKIGDNSLFLFGKLGSDGMDFGILLKTIALGGEISVIGETLVVQKADEVTLFIDGGSSFRYRCLEKELSEETLKASQKSYYDLKKKHMNDYHELFDRVKFTLGGISDNYEVMPTDRRLSLLRDRDDAGENVEDLGLYVLYFNFGRYLMISGSRPGSLPLNLQGIWNDSFTPAWDSKYTININTEMNYWPAEICNLSECHLPLFDLMERMYEHGKETARTMYGCRGIVAHHNTNIWGDTAPQDQWIPGTYWVMGFAWLSTHIWQHYEYTLDKDFLRQYFYIMLESAKFFLDFLIEDEEGYLLTCPSVSPENTYVIDEHAKGCNGCGVTMDNMILRDLFCQCIKASDILGEKYETIDQIREAVLKLRPTAIGKHGQIMEWKKDYEEAEPGHRHISQLYGLFPSDQISVKGTKELADAASVTINRRLKNGGGHTGWSRAWIINFYARLYDGQNAIEHLNKLLSKSTLSNLFDNHPPFQIDGNFGATAAIANMLVHDTGDDTVLLPALPSQWKDGSIRGLRLKGNRTIDITWEAGKVTDYKIYSQNES